VISDSNEREPRSLPGVASVFRERWEIVYQGEEGQITLPEICLMTGEPCANREVFETTQIRPVRGAAGVAWAAVESILDQSYIVECSVSPLWRRRIRILAITGFLAPLLGIALMIAGYFLAEPKLRVETLALWMEGVGLVLVIGGPIFGMFFSRRLLRVSFHAPGQIRLVGASRAFLDRLPEWEEP
jgi:hypothetical protein